MSKKTLAPSVVTHRDPKGRKFMSIVEAAYDKARLGDGKEGEAQRVNDTPGLSEVIANFIAEARATNQFANEEVPSNYTYPPEYTGVKPIDKQVDILAKIFGLSLGYTSEWMEKVLPTLALPDGAEGWFAIPSVDVVATRFFPNVKDDAQAYCKAVQLVHEKLAASRVFYNYREGQIISNRLRVHARTAHAFNLLAEGQKGDILIVPAQFGLRHRGRSVRRAREVFNANEFGLGSFAVGCMVLTHPERFVRWEQLHTDCPGDEFAPAAVGVFSGAPLFHWNDGRLRFSAYWFDLAYGHSGSVSAFLPQ